jgi:hypothetical protein
MKKASGSIQDCKRFSFSFMEDFNFITKYFPLFILLAWLFLLFYEAFSGFDFRSWGGGIQFPSITIAGISPLLTVLCSFWYFLFSRFAYRIVFDFKEGKAWFHVYYKRKPVEHFIHDLKVVNLTWHIYFKFKHGRTIWYAGNGEMFEFLSKKNIPRRWGKLLRRMNKKYFEADVTYREPLQ